MLSSHHQIHLGCPSCGGREGERKEGRERRERGRGRGRERKGGGDNDCIVQAVKLTRRG